MNTATLLVLPDGTVHGLYTEAIDLSALGTLRLRRASIIEFDHTTQCWRVFDTQGHCRYTAHSRLQCLRWEQEFFTSEVLLTPAAG